MIIVGKEYGNIGNIWKWVKWYLASFNESTALWIIIIYYKLIGNIWLNDNKVNDLIGQLQYVLIKVVSFSYGPGCLAKLGQSLPPLDFLLGKNTVYKMRRKRMMIWLVVWNIFYFSIYWEQQSQLTNIFQRGWTSI